MKTKKRFLSILLSLALVLGLMPGVSLTAYAADTTVTWNASDIVTVNPWDKSFTKDGITFAPGHADFLDKNFTNGGTFTTASGKFTKIEVTAPYVDISGTGWSGGTWTGDASSSVSYSGDIYDVGMGQLKIVFTIAPDAVAVTGVSLNKESTTLTVGGTETLTATVAPDNATDKTVTWTSSNTSVATVSNAGLVTAVAAGTATITVTATNGTADDTSDDKTATCAVTVNKADPTAPTGLTATYGQTLADVALPEGWSWADSTQSVGNVGDHTFKANFAGNDNYNATSNVDVNVTISTKAMTVSAEDVNATVDGQPHGITVTVTDPASGATVKYGTEAGSYTLDASPTQTEVGEKTVYYQVTSDNYTTYTGSAKVTVSAKQPQTITAENVTANYGDTGKSIEARTSGDGTLSYAVKSGDAVTVNETTGALTIVKAGSAVITVTASETATYAQATKEVTVTINKANAVPATVTANNRTYDGTEKPLVTVTGTPTGGEMQYALGTATEATEQYTTSIPTATEAGTYYVWYKAVGDATHSDSNPAVVTITISEETPTEPETDDGKTETEQKGSAPDNEKTSIDNDLTEIREIVSEEASVDDSDTVRLILNTNSVDESSDENKEAVDSIKSKIEADNLNIGSFLDITLSYIVEDANGAKKSSGQLTELNGRSLSVRFPIPSKLQASGRLFRIFRFHNGEVEEVGSGKGEAVILSLDKFSLYAIAYEDGAATEETEESEKKVVKPHTHTYAWDKVEATESQDGELRYQCTECYDILVRVPLSAYYVFNANTVDKINKAKQGETVKITTDRWISFHKMVFDALTARPDVTLEVSFLDGEYKGNRVSFTIPAGADNSDLFTENNFAGFMYLGNKYGLTAEEN